MAYQGQYFSIENFGGGLASTITPDRVRPDQAADANNIVIKEYGTGFRIRNGNALYDQTGDGRISGLNYFIQSNATDWLVAIGQTKIWSYAYPSTTQSDITGAITVSSNTYANYDLVPFNDILVGFGGDPTAPGAPFKWTGSGNAAALGGSPPSAVGAFTANNRMFAFNTAAARSTIYWSIIGNAEDWTGSGSGSAVIGTLEDNQGIVAATPFGTNNVLVFKTDRIYQMNITAAPFSSYLLFSGIGTINAETVCVYNGICYFLDAFRHLKATDGNRIIDFPSDNDDLFNQSTAIPLMRVFHQQGFDYDWIVITCVNQESNDVAGLAIIWDIRNKCWLKTTNAYRGLRTVSSPINSGLKQITYTGNNDGGIYEVDSATSTADAWQGSSTTVSGYWQSGWMTPKVAEQIIQVNRLGLEFVPSSGNATITYGYNFISGSGSGSISLSPDSTEVIGLKSIQLTGRGNYFQFKITADATVYTSETCITKVILRGKSFGQKAQRSIS